MNHLNSVLIEGDIVEVVDYPPGVEEAYIVIACRRSFEKDGKPMKGVSYFTVKVPINSIKDKVLIPHTLIRVVGRLVSGIDRVYIVAEHVEFKPQRKGS